MTDPDHVILVVIIAVMFVFRCGAPTRAQCPTLNEYVEGVRRDGSTWCAKSPSLRERDCTPDPVCSWSEPVYTVPLQIYCTGGTRPIVIDQRTIGCQR